MIRWNNDRASAEPVRVHSIRAGESRMFVMLCDGREVPSTYTHWIFERKQSVPCEGADHCNHHHLPMIWKAYAPVAMYRHKWNYPAKASEAEKMPTRIAFRDVSRRVLELTYNVSTILDQLHKGDFFVVQRPDYRANAPLEWFKLPGSFVVPKELQFDPRRVMERVFKGSAAPELPRQDLAEQPEPSEAGRAVE